MDVETNVIDGRGRFQRRRAVRALSDTPSSLEERLIKAGRLADADKPLLAKNLGRLAIRLDPEAPLKGAKRIVEATGIQGLWPKRKRFIRLPAEDAPPPSHSGEYGATGVTFVQLARAAAGLLTTNSRDDAVQSERERAVRILAAGTSFLPTYEPPSRAHATAKSLLDEYSDVLSSAVATRTRIRDLWSVLRHAYIGASTDQSVEDGETIGSQLGDVATIPQDLFDAMPSGVTEAVFDVQGSSPFNWEPSVTLGDVFVKMRTRMLCMPAELANTFSIATPDGDTITPEGLQWLSNGRFDFEAHKLVDTPYDWETGDGCRDVLVGVQQEVTLQVAQSDEGEPCLRLKLNGNEDVSVVALDHGSNTSSYYFDQKCNEVMELEDYATQVRIIDLGTSYVCAVFGNLSPLESTQRSRVFGLLNFCWHEDVEPNLEYFQEAGWTESPLTAQLLLEAEHLFYPRLEDCEPDGGALLEGSIGAALLANVRDGREEHSIPHLLIEKARLMADAGLRFYEAMVEDYRDAFRRI